MSFSTRRPRCNERLVSPFWLFVISIRDGVGFVDINDEMQKCTQEDGNDKRVAISAPLSEAIELNMKERNIVR